MQINLKVKDSRNHVKSSDDFNKFQCDFDISDAESSAIKDNLSKHIKNLSSSQFPLGSTNNVPKLQVDFDDPNAFDKNDF